MRERLGPTLGFVICVIVTGCASPSGDIQRQVHDVDRSLGDAMDVAAQDRRDLSPDRNAQIEAENSVTREQALAMDAYLHDPDVRAALARLRELPQPERSAEGQSLMDDNQLFPDCAFDAQHPPDYSHQKKFVMTVSCDPPPPSRSGPPP